MKRVEEISQTAQGCGGWGGREKPKQLFGGLNSTVKARLSSSPNICFLAARQRHLSVLIWKVGMATELCPQAAEVSPSLPPITLSTVFSPGEHW